MNKMLGQPIKITTPNVSLVHKNEILDGYENSCILVKVQYTEGLYGTNMLVLKDEDAKIITDLMMGNDGTGDFSNMEISALHISAVSEAMNQMTASSATAMNKMLNRKIDISPPTVEQIVIGSYEFADDIPDDTFVRINFRMQIGKLIDSTFMQLYPFDLAHSIYNLFQRRN
jgi:flagellar motor switch protein FliN/FliY